jgi:hypothetical protein
MASQTPKAGYKLNEWLAQVGFGRSTYYTLPADMKPRSIKIGASTVVIEQPTDYIARLAAKQIRAVA